MIIHVTRPPTQQLGDTDQRVLHTVRGPVYPKNVDVDDMDAEKPGADAARHCPQNPPAHNLTAAPGKGGGAAVAEPEIADKPAADGRQRPRSRNDQYAGHEHQQQPAQHLDHSGEQLQVNYAMAGANGISATGTHPRFVGENRGAMRAPHRRSP
jgi:hypothetical protein